jgi:hypothetical protein
LTEKLRSKVREVRFDYLRSCLHVTKKITVGSGTLWGEMDVISSVIIIPESRALRWYATLNRRRRKAYRKMCLYLSSPGRTI